MKTRPILKNKFYLYMTEFFSGVSVMAVELGASRLLAPYFSSSQIVWTIIIGTIMIAMALGNIYGGKSADRNPDPDRLYKRVMFAAVWIAAIPVLGKYIIIAVSGLLVLAVDSYLLIIAAFISCMVIFVFPLFLLGTVTPSLVKYTVDSLDDSGKVVGTLGAFNTVGSIIGTFVPTFVTIPAVGTSVTFLIFSGILLVLALIYFISSGKNIAGCIAAFLLFIICSIFGRSDSFAFWEKGLTYEGESIYNYLQVKDSEESTVLSTNVLFGVQSILMKDHELTGMYYDYAMAAPLMLPSDRFSGDRMDILILGMGTGTYAKQCRQYFDNSSVEGVEIDGKITELAHRYFELPEDMKVTTYDGRAYLQADSSRYDVIMVDAYQDITIPFQMSSKEFFTLVKEHLNQNGVMVVNMNMHAAEGTGDNITDYLSDTIASVFENVYTVDVPYYTNRELFASASDSMLSNFSSNQASVKDMALKKFMQSETGLFEKYERGDLLLTDDRAPVELLGMREIDSLINDEIGYYRNIYKEEGIQGLMNNM